MLKLITIFANNNHGVREKVISQLSSSSPHSMSSTTKARKPAPARSSTDKKWRAGSTLGKQNIQKRTRPGSKAAAWSDRNGAGQAESSKGKLAGVGPRKRVREEEEKDEEDEEEVKEPALIESDGEEEQPSAEVKPAKKGKRQNRKTGGTGKKQKVFVEEKVSSHRLKPFTCRVADSRRTPERPFESRGVNHRSS
jgi:hypothetical protein